MSTAYFGFLSVAGIGSAAAVLGTQVYHASVVQEAMTQGYDMIISKQPSEIESKMSVQTVNSAKGFQKEDPTACCYNVESNHSLFFGVEKLVPKKTFVSFHFPCRCQKKRKLKKPNTNWCRSVVCVGNMFNIMRR